MKINNLENILALFGGFSCSDYRNWLPLISIGFQKVAASPRDMERNMIQKPGGLDSALLARHLAGRLGEA